MRDVVLLGAGGHAKVVVATVQAAGGRVAGIYDDATDTIGGNVLDVPIRGTIEDAIHVGLPAIIAIGDNRARARIAERIGELPVARAVHPFAIVHPSARVGAGTVVFAGAVIQPDAVLGEHVIVNTGASIDHDCTIGHYAHIAPGAHLAGSVRIGAGVLIGIGSVAAPGVTVGDWAVVGAGAAIVADLPADLIATGVPARPRGWR